MQGPSGKLMVVSVSNVVSLCRQTYSKSAYTDSRCYWHSPLLAFHSDPTSRHFRNSCWALIPKPNFNIMHIPNQDDMLQYQQMLCSIPFLGLRLLPNHFPILYLDFHIIFSCKVSTDSCNYNKILTLVPPCKDCQTLYWLVFKGPVGWTKKNDHNQTEPNQMQPDHWLQLPSFEVGSVASCLTLKIFENCHKTDFNQLQPVFYSIYNILQIIYASYTYIDGKKN